QENASQFAAGEKGDLVAQSLTQLRAVFFKADDLARVDSVLTVVGDFVTSISAVQDRLDQRSALGVTAAEVDAALALQLAEDATAARLQQIEIGEATEAQTALAGTASLVAGLAVLLIGVALSLVTARWLSTAIRDIATSRDRLARGEYGGTRFEDADASELGQLAKALIIFDHNGQQLQQSMAREREDAQRTARAAERWERLRTDLQFAVDCAPVGD